MARKRTSLTVETVLNTKTVDKEMATKIVQTQVDEYLWPHIKLQKMHMHTDSGIKMLRIEYFIEHDNFLIEEDAGEESFADATAREMALENLTAEEVEMLTYEEDMAIRSGKPIVKETNKYFEYYVEIDEDANMVESTGQGIYVLPYVALLIEEDFVKQITSYH